MHIHRRSVPVVDAFSGSYWTH